MKLVVATRKDYYDPTHFLTTTTKTFRNDSDPEKRFFPGLLHSIKKPDGTMSVVLYFRGTFNTATRSFTASKGGPEVLKLTLNGTSIVSSDSASMPSYSLGSPLSPSTGDQTQVTETDFRVVPGISTAEALVTAADGTTICVASLICTGTPSAPAWQVNQRDVHHYIDTFFLERTSRDSGNTAATWDIITNSWTKGRLDYTIDDSGTRTNFTYDSSGRPATKTRLGAALGSATSPTLTTSFVYDATGKITSQTTSNSNSTSETLVTARSYDIAGRTISEMTAGYATAGSSSTSAVVTSFDYGSYADPYRTTTTTLPSGATRIETRYKDGRVKSITGSGVVAQYFSDVMWQADRRIKQATYSKTSGDSRVSEKWTV